MVSSGDLSRMVRLGRDVTVEDRVDLRCDVRDGAVETGAKADVDAAEKAMIRAATECFMVPSFYCFTSCIDPSLSPVTLSCRRKSHGTWCGVMWRGGVMSHSP
jgi:hypothetical protein